MLSGVFSVFQSSKKHNFVWSMVFQCTSGPKIRISCGQRCFHSFGVLKNPNTSILLLSNSEQAAFRGDPVAAALKQGPEPTEVAKQLFLDEFERK